MRLPSPMCVVFAKPVLETERLWVPGWSSEMMKIPFALVCVDRARRDFGSHQSCPCYHRARGRATYGGPPTPNVTAIRVSIRTGSAEHIAGLNSHRVAAFLAALWNCKTSGASNLTWDTVPSGSMRA